jgi:hypothetical protein
MVILTVTTCSLKKADGLHVKTAVFWVIVLCSLVKVYQSFRGPYCLHHQGNECFRHNSN